MRVKRIASPFPTTRRLQLPAALTRRCNPSPPPKNESFSRLGEEIKRLRIADGASGGELARRCGISRSMLSRIERGLVSPSVDTLNQLAKGLGVSPSRFFCHQNSRTDLSFVAAGNGIVIDRMGELVDFQYELLGHLLSGNLFVEPYLVRLLPNAKPFANFLHPGLQFMYFLSGRVLYRYGGKSMDVGQGDSLLFETSVLHGVEKVVEEPVSYLMINFTTRN